MASKRTAWVSGWTSGGWATHGSDLGAPDARFGQMDVTGNLMATGSDNDHEIYRKFRMDCHPCVNRAGVGLAALVNASPTDARSALVCRGAAYRAMVDDLLPRVLTPSAREKGSARERRAWDVADMLSRVLSRATTLQIGGRGGAAIVPIHERLGNCDGRGENVKLVGQSPLEGEEAEEVSTPNGKEADS